MKQALLLVAIDPTIGGVLIMGDRGTGKSTCVRALAALLPAIDVVDDCPYHCNPGRHERQCDECRSKADATKKGRLTSKTIQVPIVELPIGATEDRVVGSLDIEQALLFGRKKFEPGLLAKANRGFLYIDEINLLDDHIVDLLLDVAASGEHIVEREGFSTRHPAEFVIVGSGNPEEGELRPQLLDRFGLSLEVASPADIDQRIEAVRRRDAFDRDRIAFCKKWAKADAILARRIVAARAHLDNVSVPDGALAFAARLCLQIGSDGLRGELTLIRAARALAAFRAENEITPELVAEVATITLCHRLRKDPLDETTSHVRVARALESIRDN